MKWMTITIILKWYTNNVINLNDNDSDTNNDMTTIQVRSYD